MSPILVAIKVLVFQCVFALICVAALFFFNKTWVVSWSVGCLIGWLANLFFARRIFAFSGAQQAKQIARSLYWGVAGKWLIVIALFWLALKMSFVLALPLLLGFLSMQFAHSFGLVLCR